jgi:hypothetical protein
MNMTPATSTRRFRTNPVEIAILGVITLVFANSVYRLIDDRESFNPVALTPMKANPVSSGRSPASVSQSFISVELGCGNTTADHQTAATKMRITGPLCGTQHHDGAQKLTKTKVINNANSFNATVFTDVNVDKFSTDYIPLNTGQNQIQITFAYMDGSSISREIIVTRE